jgi:hypothetical protein
MTGPVLALAVPVGEAVAHRCRAPRRDGTGPCGRPLYDAESIARGDIGPECFDRIYGPAPGTRHAGPTSPGPDQDVLPLDDLTGDETSTCPSCGQPIPPQAAAARPIT